jgi:hypothetical protein
MVGLTTKQKEELNLAVLEYLVKQNFRATAQKFAEETSLKMPDENIK